MHHLNPDPRENVQHRPQVQALHRSTRVVMLGLHRERMLMKYPHLSELLAQRWYVVVNDVIGGWSVSNVDKPMSQQHPKYGEWEICDFVEKEAAEAIAGEHNMRLDEHEQRAPTAG